MNPITAHLTKELSEASRNAYRHGNFIRPAVVSRELAERIVEAMPVFAPRLKMKELLITNGNEAVWVNHSMTSIINKALLVFDSNRTRLRLGRCGVYARLYEVSIIADDDYLIGLS